MHVFQESGAVVLIGKEHTCMHLLFEKDVSFVVQSVLYIGNRVFREKHRDLHINSYLQGIWE